SNECRRHYLTTALSQQETPFLGQLRAYTFRLPEHALNVEVGPRLLALGAITDQRLPQCVVSENWRWLIDRDPSAEEARWLERLALRFSQSGFNYRGLIKALVTSEYYRRIR
ncbi:MAG: hypothetical protein VYD19_01060, partial [Myxococcota bacterium]|nr:hypothetical protein [Myxococcota bacterium]